MTDDERQELKALLQKSVPSLSEPELQHDLWPRMLLRLDSQPIWLRWLDWALGAIALGWLFAFPQIIPGLLFQL